MYTIYTYFTDFFVIGVLVMVNADDVPYGALYTFQPDYMGHLIHDEIIHEDDVAEVHVPVFWKVCVGRVRDFFAGI
jgi:hypothetical protein